LGHVCVKPVKVFHDYLISFEKLIYFFVSEVSIVSDISADLIYKEIAAS